MQRRPRERGKCGKRAAAVRPVRSFIFRLLSLHRRIDVRQTWRQFEKEP